VQELWRTPSKAAYNAGLRWTTSVSIRLTGLERTIPLRQPWPDTERKPCRIPE